MYLLVVIQDTVWQKKSDFYTDHTDRKFSLQNSSGTAGGHANLYQVVVHSSGTLHKVRNSHWNLKEVLLQHLIEIVMWHYIKQKQNNSMVSAKFNFITKFFFFFYLGIMLKHANCTLNWLLLSFTKLGKGDEPRRSHWHLLNY